MTSQVASRDMNAKGHILALDGLRGLAILLVLSSHISERFQCDGTFWTGIRNVAFGGWTGVDLFFVLSGFLITGILWDTRDAAHYFWNFYARRTLRIVPLNYGSLILLFFILPAVAPFLIHVPAHLRGGIQGVVETMGAAGGHWPWFFTYLVNVLVAVKGFNIAMTHLWSLSVEEHFYLVWPLLVHRLKFRTLMITSATLVVVALVIRIAALPFVNRYAIYTLTPFRMDGLALGALLALLWRVPEYQAKIKSWARFVMPITGFALLIILLRKGTVSQYGRTPQSVGYTLSVLAYGAMLVLSLEAGWLNSIFRLRFLRFFGKYSYSIYIFHVLPLFIAAPTFALGNAYHFSCVARLLEFISDRPEYSLSGLPLSTPMLWLDGIVYVVFVPAASAAIGMFTWYALEAPCLRLKRYFSYEKRDKPVEGSRIVADLVRG